jgi:selenocysteine lyase/cysteine desulfurase
LGWTSVKNAWNFLDYNIDPLDSAARYENGTLNALGITALDTSLDLFLTYGSARIEERILSNSEYFFLKLNEAGIETLLKNSPREEYGGIVTIRIKEPEKIFARLNGMKIYSSLREGLIRFSPHFYNTKEEIDHVVDEVRKLVD